MAAKRISGRVPKRKGIYCLTSTINTKSTRCVRRYADGKVRFLKAGNISCGCKKARKR